MGMNVCPGSILDMCVCDALCWFLSTLVFQYSLALTGDKPVGLLWTDLRSEVQPACCSTGIRQEGAREDWPGSHYHK